MARKALIVLCVLGIITCTSILVTSMKKDVTEYVHMIQVNKRVQEEKDTYAHASGSAVRKDVETLPTWIKEQTGLIDLPIMQYTDNSFYLEHDAEGNPSKYGAIFLDARCRVNDDILLIHGHNTKSGDMFGFLKSYVRVDSFIDEHKIFEISFGQSVKEYEVQDYAIIRDTDSLYLGSKVPYGYLDKGIILSTCYGNAGTSERLILLLVEK